VKASEPKNSSVKAPEQQNSIVKTSEPKNSSVKAPEQQNSFVKTPEHHKILICKIRPAKNSSFTITRNR